MHIVIIGGGFAGINLAKALTNEKGITTITIFSTDAGHSGKCSR